MDSGGDDDGQKTVPPWRRLITVARYTVVSVVTVVAINVVIVKSLSMVLRPKDIHLVLVGGSVLVDRFAVKQPRSVWCRFTYTAYNPTGLRVTYSNITGSFVDESDKDPFGKFIHFDLPQKMVETTHVVRGSPYVIPDSDVLFSTLYDENNITVAFQLNGNLTTYHPSGRNTTAWYTFYCWPMTLGYIPGSGDDVSCVRDK